MINMNKLKEKIASLPDAPGVYLMKGDADKVIYIGKAKSLKKRLISYLSRDLSTKTIAMLSKVSDIEYRLCANESLALILEAELVHKYQPQYNVSLRDDKSFPLVKITNEEFPAVFMTRKKIKDGARYFGPYTNAKLLRQALKLIRRNFPYRSCKKLPSKACIYYRIKLSPAPCIGKISKKEYAQTIQNICLILQGKTQTLIKKLSHQMHLYSTQLKFEEAAKMRDKINALASLQQSQIPSNSQDALADLKNLLRLDKLPQRIEAFDISNISGREATGAMVSFYNGVADKNNYRRFRIKTVETIDDYKMLREVIQRRYLRLIKENLPLPDLILIDGGRSHLFTAQAKLRTLRLKIPLVSIAKEKENIYSLEILKPIKLNQDTPALNLLRRIRDEAHRFALSYHHLLRRKKVLGK